MKTIFKADDGREFDTLLDCKNYELLQKKFIDKNFYLVSTETGTLISGEKIKIDLISTAEMRGGYHTIRNIHYSAKISTKDDITISNSGQCSADYLHSCCFLFNEIEYQIEMENIKKLKELIAHFRNNYNALYRLDAILNKSEDKNEA